ncbi:hypothetical protein SHIRM173S_03362 [Streptomyces hirsutus]
MRFIQVLTAALPPQQFQGLADLVVRHRGERPVLAGPFVGLSRPGPVVCGWCSGRRASRGRHPQGSPAPHHLRPVRGTGTHVQAGRGPRHVVLGQTAASGRHAALPVPPPCLPRPAGTGAESDPGTAGEASRGAGRPDGPVRCELPASARGTVARVHTHPGGVTGGVQAQLGRTARGCPADVRDDFPSFRGTMAPWVLPGEPFLVGVDDDVRARAVQRRTSHRFHIGDDSGGLGSALPGIQIGR